VSEEFPDLTGTVDAFPVWDADLSLGDVKRLRPADKGLRARSSLARKIGLLESWGRNGLPPGAEASIPWDRAKLRRWRDPARRLWAWVDPQVDMPKGRNAGLMDRFRLALQAVQVRRKDRGSNLKRQVEALKITVENLERQNISLLDQVRQLQKKVVAPRATRS